MTTGSCADTGPRRRDCRSSSGGLPRTARAPVPRLREPVDAGPGAQPRGDLLMQRLHGPSMLQAILQGVITAEDAGAMLARLLHRLHSVPARLGADRTHRVLHLDLHPDNVMISDNGTVVIDWRNTEEGPPGPDWAMSALNLAQAAIDSTAHAAVARAVLAHCSPTPMARSLWMNPARDALQRPGTDEQPTRP